MGSGSCDGGEHQELPKGRFQLHIALPYQLSVDEKRRQFQVATPYPKVFAEIKRFQGYGSYVRSTSSKLWHCASFPLSRLDEVRKALEKFDRALQDWIEFAGNPTGWEPGIKRMLPIPMVICRYERRGVIEIQTRYPRIFEMLSKYAVWKCSREFKGSLTHSVYYRPPNQEMESEIEAVLGAFNARYLRKVAGVDLDEKLREALERMWEGGLIASERSSGTVRRLRMLGFNIKKITIRNRSAYIFDNPRGREWAARALNARRRSELMVVFDGFREEMHKFVRKPRKRKEFIWDGVLGLLRLIRKPRRLPKQLPIEEIAEKYRKGCRIEELCREYGVSSHTIYDRLRKAGVGLRRWSKLDPDKLRELWSQGVSIPEIASALKCHPSTVRLKLVKMGLLKPRRNREAPRPAN